MLKSEPCPAFGHAAEASSEAPAPNQKSMNAGWPHTVLLDVHAAEIHSAQAMACDYAQDGQKAKPEPYPLIGHSAEATSEQAAPFDMAHDYEG